MTKHISFVYTLEKQYPVNYNRSVTCCDQSRTHSHAEIAQRWNLQKKKGWGGGGGGKDL